MEEWEVESMQVAITFRRKCVQWLVRRPAFAFSLILLCCMITLPAIMVVALTPFVFFFNYLGIIAETDDTTTIYNVLLNGFLLAVVITSVITITFLAITCACVIHSHKSFIIFKPKKCS